MCTARATAPNRRRGRWARDCCCERADRTLSEFPVEISLKPLLRDGTCSSSPRFATSPNASPPKSISTGYCSHSMRPTTECSSSTTVSLRYSYVNEGAVRLVGYTRDELMTMTPLHLNPNDSEQELPDVHRVVEGQSGRAADASDAPAPQGRQRDPGREDLPHRPDRSRRITLDHRPRPRHLRATGHRRRAPAQPGGAPRGRARRRHRRRPRAHRQGPARQGHPTALRGGTQHPSGRRCHRRPCPAAARVDDRLDRRHHPRAPNGDLLAAGVQAVRPVACAARSSTS